MQAKVFNKGQLVIPVALRKRYGIEIGKTVEIRDEKDGIKIVSIREKGSIGELQGIFNKYAKGRILRKEGVEKATERGFTEGYR
jgi:bifunctional DNA-binding transcriptional regulator/antitoxin component of YhaV-PrlF toxin-antitoxin module